LDGRLHAKKPRHLVGRRWSWTALCQLLCTLQETSSAVCAAATSTCACLPACPAQQAVFKPEIVQIWVDNLADLWGNINLLAADLFARCARTAAGA